MQLHDFQLSGNCYKVRLFLGLLGLQAERIRVDLPGGEQKRPEFLALNPRGQVPVLVEDGRAVADSQGILAYLARRHGNSHWYPEDAFAQGEVVGWLSFAANEIHHGPALARAGVKFGRPVNVVEAQARARQVLSRVDAHLAPRSWLVGEHPSIADVAVYPYLALAEEGGLELAPYKHLRAWFDRLRALPGYVELPR